MYFVGIDLHKKTISLCVVDQERNVLDRKRLYCSQPEGIEALFGRLRPFQAVVEATASYEWLVKLIEALADRMVLAQTKASSLTPQTVKDWVRGAMRLTSERQPLLRLSLRTVRGGLRLGLGFRRGSRPRFRCRYGARRSASYGHVKASYSSKGS